MTQVRAPRIGLPFFRLFSLLFAALILAAPSIVMAATAPTVTISASPAFVASGATSKITWSSTNATSCTASGNWSGAKALSGSLTTGPLTTNVAYKLTCNGAGGSVTKAAYVNIKPTLTLTASPTAVASGATTKLTWSTTRATSCTASGNWSGTKSTSGSATTAAIRANSSYTLTCTGAGGSIAKTVAVTVKSGTVAPVVTLSASPTSVKPGAASQLTWSATNATSCTASGAWTGAKGMSGSQSTGALNTNKNYTLTCTGAGGSAAKTTSVTVTSGAVLPVVTLTASPSNVNSGSASQLTWSATNATSCTASGAWSGTKGTSGSQSTGALTASKNYTLTCTGVGGSAAKTASVTVATATAPKVTLTANPRSVARNTNTTLSWTGTNVTSCTASGGWTGTKAASGSQSVGPLTQDTTYTLNCTGSGGNAVVMTTVSIREAALTWSAPTKNTDGTTATLSGYKIYYGTSPSSYSQVVSVSGGSTLQHTITLPSSGTWYFAMTAVDSKGVESAKTTQVSKVVE